jgi:NADH dehydrogenase (ubiquinone) 1 alpha subcomplex subunit 13
MGEFLKRGFPGLQSIKDLPILQDRPPPGGFPSIRVDKRLPSTGPTGAVLIGVGLAVMAYGHYKLSIYSHDIKSEAEEIRAIRQTILPVLQAEYELRYLKDARTRSAYEAEIMKNVPGFTPGECTTRHRWMMPKEHFLSRSLI